MDFTKYRDSGELSDVSVTVDGKEFKLHKFLLYTKSDFFMNQLKSKPDGHVAITLEDFPGGADTFEQVANSLYYMRVNVNKENVCKLRCAAEKLQMSGKGNLIELTDRCLQDTVTEAKLGRSPDSTVDLLLQACELGEIAEESKVTERCVTGVVDSWLIQSSRFGRRSFGSKQPDDLKKLCKIPLPVFKQVFTTARDKNVRATLLATVLQLYTTAVADHLDKDTKADEEKKDDKAEEKKDQTAKENVADEKENKEEAEDGEGEDAAEEKAPGDDAAPEKSDKAEPSEETKEEDEKETDGDDTEPAETDLKLVLDTLLPEMPLTASMSEAITPDWAVRMLVKAEELECEKKDVLYNLVRRIIYRLKAPELTQIPPSVLCDVLKQQTDDNKHMPQLVCHVIDNYLLEMANKEELTVDTFRNMVQAVPPEYRKNHDSLFQILEQLLNSERANITEEQRQILLEVVDYRRMNEKTLRRAYDENLVPAPYVTEAALSLCEQLRSDLETARATIRTQDAELERYGLGEAPLMATVPYTWYLINRINLLGDWLLTLDLEHTIAIAGEENRGVSSRYDAAVSSSRRTDVDSALYSRYDDDDLLNDDTFTRDYRSRSYGSYSYEPRSTAYYTLGTSPRSKYGSRWYSK